MRAWAPRRWAGCNFLIAMAAALACGVGPERPDGPSGAEVGGADAGASHGSHDGLLIDELRHRLCDLGNLTRRSAGPALTVEAFGAFESLFFQEVECMQKLAPALWRGPDLPPSLHNWVPFQGLHAALSAVGRWPCMLVLA